MVAFDSSRLLLCLLGALALSACGPKADSPKKALLGATMLDGTGAPAIPSSAILIDNGLFTAVGPESATQIPDGFEKVNVGGKFIVPGLIDAHVTLDRDPVKANTQLQAFLAAGITSVGADTKSAASGPHIFPSLGKQPGIADLVIASNGSGPEATLAKIERMAKAEIPPAQIVQAASLTAAEWLQQANLGSIRPGKRADLLVLEGDPAADIKNLRKIYRIMLDGHWVELAPLK